MAKQKLVVRSNEYTDVVFMGYTVKDDKDVTHTFAKFTMRYAVTGVPDWILQDASAHRWITEQASLRGSAARIKTLEGKVLDPTKNLASQLTIDPETVVAVTDEEATLLRMLAAIEAKLAAKKAAK